MTRYQDKTYDEIKSADPDIAIIPLGSFEQHGPHLPLGTDIFLVEALAGAVAEKLGAFLLPVQPFSTCYEHHGKKGSVHYEAGTFYKFLIRIVESIYKSGFRKIAIIPGHGGIFVLEPAVRHLNASHDDLTVITVDAYDISAFPASTYFDEIAADGIHAGDAETSLMLYLKPDLVDMAKAVDFIPEKPRPYLNYGSIFTLSPTGVWGNAARASADKGRWLFENAVDATIVKINRIFTDLSH